MSCVACVLVSVPHSFLLFWICLHGFMVCPVSVITVQFPGFIFVMCIFEVLFGFVGLFFIYYLGLAFFTIF